MILRYLFLSIIQVLLMLVQFFFSWLIALSVTKDGHLRLLPPLFEPTDSLAIGDRAYWDNEMSYCMGWPISIRNYWLALNWGVRNPAYGFADMAGFTINNAHSLHIKLQMLRIMGGILSLAGQPQLDFNNNYNNRTN
jgi:hypothetical protein